MSFVFTGGLPETACGYGSTLDCTVHLRAELLGMLRRLGVTRLVDVPCGDFNWLAQADLTDIDYVGCDVDRAHLATARVKLESSLLSPRSALFVQLDATIDNLPCADAMLCRDFLQHLPNADVFQVLYVFLDSKTTWLLATSFDNTENADLEKRGGFRPLNLTKPPFCLSVPDCIIDDPPESGRVLGAWHRNDVRDACQ